MCETTTTSLRQIAIPLRKSEGESHQDEDVSLAIGVQVVCKLGQLLEFDFVVGEILLVLHVVNVGVLDVLQIHEKKHGWSGGNVTIIIPEN